MASAKDWIKAARLRTLPLSLSGIIVGGAFGLTSPNWNGLIFALALITTVLFQVISNFANDLGDTLKGADTDERVGPQRTVQSGAISVLQMKRAVALISILAFISASLLIYCSKDQLNTNYQIGYIVLAICCILAALGYTLGKNAYAYLGLGDIFVFLFFGIVGVGGVYPLLTGNLDFQLIFACLAIGFWSTAVLNLNNMRDIENDAKVGKITLVVRLGSRNALIYHYFLILIGCLSWVSFILNTSNSILYTNLGLLLFFGAHLLRIRNYKTPKEFDPELKRVALLTFIVSISYFIFQCLF